MDFFYIRDEDAKINFPYEAADFNLFMYNKDFNEIRKKLQLLLSITLKDIRMLKSKVL